MVVREVGFSFSLDMSLKEFDNLPYNLIVLVVRNHLVS